MSESDDLIETLARHRGFLLYTAEGLPEEQARTASTVSALTLAGLLKHVADTEEQWMQFALRGAEAFAASEVYDADVDWDAVDAAAEANGGNWQGSEWSVRRVALHVLAEISQHACHGDIIREAIDGQRTMG